MKILITISRLKHAILSFLCIPALRSRRFLDDLETIQYVLDHNCSLSRYGNGEMNILLGQGIPFQDYSPGLKKALMEVVTDERCLVCTPSFVCQRLKKGVLEDFQYRWWKKEAHYTRYCYFKFFKKSTLLGDTQCTRFYMDYKNKSSERIMKYVHLFQKIWADRDILIIEGEQTLLGVGNDLFACAKSIKRILCPRKNAFDVIDSVRSWVNANISVQSLVILALGPSATILSYRLAHDGYQALDLGHIDIEYSWFLNGALTKVPVPHKYVNEAAEGRNPAPYQNQSFVGQIIKTFLDSH